MKTKTIRAVVIRLALGTLLHGTSYAGPATQLYLPVPPPVVNNFQSPAQPKRRLVFTTPSQNAGTPRLFDFGEGVIGVDE
jgi:hypothetical protein